MAEFDTTQLVESIRTRGQIPNAGDWTDQKILDLATEELRASIAPAVLSVREGYYEEVIDFAFTSTLPRYRIPRWAIGQKLGGAYYVPVNQQPYPLELLNEKQLQSLGLTDTRPLGYIIRGNVIIPFPAPATGSTGKIRIKYQARPSSLVLPSACVVGSVSAGTGVVNSAGDGQGSTTPFTSGDLVDIIQSTPGFEVVIRNATMTFAGATTFSITDPANGVGSLTGGDLFLSTGGPVSGEYPTVAKAGTTCFPQCPTEFWYILAQTVAVKYLENQGFVDELQIARAELQRLVSQAMPTITPRGGEDTKKFKNTKFFPRG